MVFQQRRMYLSEAVVALVLARARHPLVSVLYSLQLRWASEVLYSVRVLLSRRKCVRFRFQNEREVLWGLDGTSPSARAPHILHSPHPSICAHSQPALSDHPLSPGRVSVSAADLSYHCFFSARQPRLQPPFIRTLVVPALAPPLKHWHASLNLVSISSLFFSRDFHNT